MRPVEQKSRIKFSDGMKIRLFNNQFLCPKLTKEDNRHQTGEIGEHQHRHSFRHLHVVVGRSGLLADYAQIHFAVASADQHEVDGAEAENEDQVCIIVGVSRLHRQTDGGFTVARDAHKGQR